MICQYKVKKKLLPQLFFLIHKMFKVLNISLVLLFGDLKWRYYYFLPWKVDCYLLFSSYLSTCKWQFLNFHENCITSPCSEHLKRCFVLCNILKLKKHSNCSSNMHFIMLGNHYSYLVWIDFYFIQNDILHHFFSFCYTR